MRPRDLKIAARVHAENVGTVGSSRSVYRPSRSVAAAVVRPTTETIAPATGRLLSSSTRPSMMPAGNAVRLDPASFDGACAYAAVSAKHEHRDCRRRDPSGHNPPLPPAVPCLIYDTVNGTFRVIVWLLVLSVTLISSR